MSGKLNSYKLSSGTYEWRFKRASVGAVAISKAAVKRLRKDLININMITIYSLS